MSDFNVGERLNLLGRVGTYQGVVFENGEVKYLVLIDGDTHPTVWTVEQMGDFKPIVQDDKSVEHFLKGVAWLRGKLMSSAYGEDISLEVQIGSEYMDVDYPIAERLREFVDQYSDITPEQAKEVLND